MEDSELHNNVKPVNGFDDEQKTLLGDSKPFGDYVVYENGRIFSNISKRFMNNHFNKINKNYAITFRIDGKQRTFKVHSLLYQLFVGEVDSKNYVGYKDHDFHNYHLNNLILRAKNEGKGNRDMVFNLDENNKYIPGYENRYIINRDGQITSCLTGKLKVDSLTKVDQVYPSFQLIDKDGKMKTHRAINLVWKTFVGEIPKGATVEYIDGSSTESVNNNVDNIRLLTSSENNRSLHPNKKRKREKKSEELQSTDFVNMGSYKLRDFSDYEINKHGQIRNINRRKLLFNTYVYNDYKKLNLNAKNLTKPTVSLFLHELVATVFVPNSENLSFVRHKDGDKNNNNVSNLEWCVKPKKPAHVLSKKVGKYTLTGVFIEEYESTISAGKQFSKAACSAISLVCREKQNSAYGFKWKYL